MLKELESIMVRYREALKDVDFMIWWTVYNPDWEYETSGETILAYDAWRAGSKRGK